MKKSVIFASSINDAMSDYQIHLDDDNRGLTDEELAERLKDNPPLTMEAFPELSEREFIDMVKSQAGRLTEGLEGWL